MRRESHTSDKIALLATGDEITSGDILNTNSQEIAQRLTNNGMSVGNHMTTSDNVAEIESAIHFLLKTHRALIITGGLGPTSDDLTRYALAKAVNRPLVFDDATWEAICERHKLLGYTGALPEGNRQQALFPEGATIIPNPNGTAASCLVQHGEQIIFMLPGPPPECLPIVDNVVLEHLKKANFQHVSFRQSWMLFGVSEGKIAGELDAIAQPYDCTTGYRLFYPYIEFKLLSNHKKDFETVMPMIQTAVAPYIISEGKKTASMELHEKLKNINFSLGIRDDATGGSLESTLKTPSTCAHLNFAPTENTLPRVEITGLNEFWNGEKTIEAQIEIKFFAKNFQNTLQRKIPYRGMRIKLYAVEFICHQINSFLSQVQ